MFIDTAHITIKAGRGGDGAVSFHREKYVSHGGPDGGDGGRGGHVWLKADPHMSTLMDFRYKRAYAAGDGKPGSGKGCSGRGGDDLTIRLPLGTLVRDQASGAVIHDLSEADPFLLARGGRGGWGNQHFATPTRQCPRFAKPGLPGESLDIVLELKLIADIGLIGLPNAGKSTLLSVVSAARPKIAGYPFTTLTPNLGVVHVDEGTSFVVSDIPGLIQGAADGAGLGHEFLRHVERCRLLVYVVDIAGSEGRDPVEDFETLRAELLAYRNNGNNGGGDGGDGAGRPTLDGKPWMVAANKCDLLSDEAPLTALRAHLEALGADFGADLGTDMGADLGADVPLFAISGATRRGVDALIGAMAERLQHLPPAKRYEADYVPPVPTGGSASDLVIRREDDAWIIEGAWLSRLMGSVNLGDHESRMFFDRKLRQAGLFDRLEAMGINEGDTVSLYDFAFEYIR
ncbi:MAG: GTPase ObgE [Oscillospiraceae bacterium]|nr:GTPase ObgE [Oscillospiraceae bacterium]